MSIKSTYSDADMINNLLTGYAQPDPTREFKSAKWNYVNDNNNNSYASGNIVFNTIHLRNVWKDWNNAYCVIPLSITSSSTAYDGSESLAWKESVLSFIYGIMVKLNGVSIVQDDNIQYINNLKLLLKSKEWANISGPELMYAKDTNVCTNANDSSQLITTTLYTGASAVATVTDTVSTPIGSFNSNYNDGLHKRSSYFRGDYAHFQTGGPLVRTSAQSINFVSAGGVHTAGPYTGAVPRSVSSTAPTVSSYSFDMKVPLKYIHSFFEELDFPLINDQLELTILTTKNSSATINYKPLMLPTGEEVPVIAIRGQCRLYYRRLEFNAREQTIINEIVAKGIVKEVHYIKSNWFQPLTANTSTSITQLITSSAINPVRVWSIMRPAGKALLEVNGQTQIANVPLTTSNLLVNNTKLFDSDLETIDEHWEQMKEQLIDYVENSNKSQITFLDYKNLFSGYNVYDLIRNKYNVLTKNSSSELTFKCTKPATSVDCEFIVEREAQVNIPLGGTDGVLVVQG